MDVTGDVTGTSIPTPSRRAMDDGFNPGNRRWSTICSRSQVADRLLAAVRKAMGWILRRALRQEPANQPWLRYDRPPGGGGVRSGAPQQFHIFGATIHLAGPK